LDANTVHDFCTDFGTAQEAVQAGVVPQCATAANTHWDIWSAFYISLTFDPLLSTTNDLIALLQVFAQHYCSRKITPSHKPVQSCTMEDAMHSVGQMFTGMGATDPHLMGQGKIDFHLQHQLLASYTKKDPPPNWVKPIPASVIRHVMYATHASTVVCNLVAVADMITLAFFFLLCPGKYPGSVSDTTPFHFRGI
jgi:hypothetical protein